MSIEQLEEIDYSYPKHGKIKWLTVVLSLFILTVLSYFPITYKIKSFIKKQAQSIPGCRMNYKDIQTEFFMPKFIVKDLTLPGRCFGKPGLSPLKLKNVYLHIRGLSFSPFGPHFMLETKLLEDNIKAYITVGMSSVSLNILDTDIDAKTLGLFVKDIKLLGKFKLATSIETGDKGLSDLKLNIRSNNLVVPPQKVKGLSLYTLKINDLLVKVFMEGKKVIVKDLIIGDVNSPIRANYKGNLKLFMNQMYKSTIDLKGEVKFSSKFLEDYAILKVMLPRFTKKDEFYQINFKGPLMEPTISSK